MRHFEFFMSAYLLFWLVPFALIFWVFIQNKKLAKRLDELEKKS